MSGMAFSGGDGVPPCVCPSCLVAAWRAATDNAYMQAVISGDVTSSLRAFHETEFWELAHVAAR